MDAVEQACALVRAGEWRAQLDVLERAVRDGVAAAAVPLAELRAYLGEWDRVVELTSISLGPWPTPVYAGNVIDGQAGLLVRAGTQDDPASVVRVYTELYDRAEQAELAGEKPTSARSLRRFAAAVDALAAGTPVQLTTLSSIEPSGKDLPAPDSAAILAAATTDSANRDFRGACARSRFGLAVALHRRFAEHITPDLQVVLNLASWSARTGETDLAWELINEHLTGWMAVDRYTVAPPEPLIDDALFALLTPERRIDVLDTPRTVQ